MFIEQWIPSLNVRLLQEKVKKINRKAMKLGLEEISLEILEEGIERLPIFGMARRTGHMGTKTAPCYENPYIGRGGPDKRMGTKGCFRLHERRGSHYSGSARGRNPRNDITKPTIHATIAGIFASGVQRTF